MSFVDACSVNAAEDMLEVFPLVQAATLVIFVSSTQGNGELPSLARKFFSILFDKNGSILCGKHCAVLGFGSSSYPIFCGAASQLSKMLAKVNAKEVVSQGQCDSVKGEGPTFHHWTTNLVMEMASMHGASDLMLKLASDMKGTASSLVRARNLLNCVKVEVFTENEVEIAAAMSYMTKRSRRRSSALIGSSRRGSLINSSGRRTSIDSFGSNPPCDVKISVHTNERLMQIMSSSSTEFSNKDILEGRVKSREDVISSVVREEGSQAATRKTSLVKIELQSCGSECMSPLFVVFLATNVLMNDVISTKIQTRRINQATISAFSLPTLLNLSSCRCLFAMSLMVRQQTISAWKTTYLSRSKTKMFQGQSLLLRDPSSTRACTI